MRIGLRGDAGTFCFTKHEEHVRAYGFAQTPPLSQTYPLLFVLVKCRRSEHRSPNTTKPDVILTTPLTQGVLDPQLGSLN